MSLENAPDDVKLAVDLIVLLEENQIPARTVLRALDIVKRDYEKKLTSDDEAEKLEINGAAKGPLRWWANAKLPDALRLSGLHRSCNILNSCGFVGRIRRSRRIRHEQRALC